MAQMNMIQALNSAMDVMMARDPSVVVMGEDVGYFGGVFRVTDGLQRKYGEHRVLDSPISEGGIVATAIFYYYGGGLAEQSWTLFLTVFASGTSWKSMRARCGDGSASAREAFTRGFGDVVTMCDNHIEERPSSIETSHRREEHL
jgi:hypothetical protein